MSNGTNAKNLLNETVTFIQHRLPGLDAGHYELKVSQRVNDSTGAPIKDDSLTNSYTFAVLGDRFSLKNPADAVFSVFPDDNASGEFTTVLPHVVFTKTTFPWSRFPTNTEPVAKPNPGEDTHDDVPSFLAVLLLDEDDLARFASLTLGAKSATIGDLFLPTIHSSSTLGNNYSYFRNATDTSGLETDELGDPILVLDIPLTLFWEIAPSVEDLKLLAHVRKVSLINKPTGTGAADPGEPTGEFSIVFGNRLPQTKKKAFCFLVSLERLEDFLPASDGTPPSGTTFNAALFLRLAVLKSWTFFSTGETASFTDALLALNGRAPGSTTDATNTNLRLPYAGSNKVVKDALDMGYVPLNHALRTSGKTVGKTVSWYRGPLVPYSITNERVAVPIASSDQALMFDPTTGMFDASYAAAWTLGRMLALQDTAFSTALYNWKRGLAQSVINGVEDDILQGAFEALLSAGPQPMALAQSAEVTASRALVHKLIQALQPVR